MKIRVLGCSGGIVPGLRTVSLLVDGKLLIDAGSVASVLSRGEQKRVEHVVMTHAHIDHVKELPFLVANTLPRDEPMPIHGARPVLDDIRRHVFNEVLWADFAKGPNPALRYMPLRVGKANEIGAYTVIPVRVNHPVYATGLIVKRGKKAFGFTTDTGPTNAFWKAAKKHEIAALFAEVTFPSEHEYLADKTLHLTPRLLAAEFDKPGRPDIPVYAYHLKPEFAGRIAAQLRGLPFDARVLEQDQVIRV